MMVLLVEVVTVFLLVSWVWALRLLVGMGSSTEQVAFASKAEVQAQRRLRRGRPVVGA